MSLLDEEQVVTEKELIVLVKQWIHNHPERFQSGSRALYDLINLEKIKRFAGAPIEYIEERIELNKKVEENYHKIYISIILATTVSTYLYFLSQYLLKILNLIETGNFTNPMPLYIFLIIILLGVLAVFLNIKFYILKYTGLLRVILDSEIEIYYLSLIKKNRELNNE